MNNEQTSRDFLKNIEYFSKLKRQEKEVKDFAWKCKKEFIDFIEVEGTTRGNISRYSIEKLLEDLGFPFETEGHVIILNPKTTPIRLTCKYSKSNENGFFGFDQVRSDDDRYQYVMFTAISPERCEHYCIPRESLRMFNIQKMHHGTNDSYHLSSNAETYTGQTNMETLKLFGDGSFKSAMDVMTWE